MRELLGQIRELGEAIKKWLIGLRAELEMKSAIRATNGVYSKAREKRNYERENRQYLVLLAVPAIKRRWNKKILIKKEKLYWVNRENFRAVKKARWLKPSMKLNELRGKAFYYTEKNRSYEQEQSAIQSAVDKYRSYLLECN